MISIDNDALNKIYECSLEFGKNWRRPILDIVQEILPNRSIEEQTEISAYIAGTRSKIETYFCERYVSDQSDLISALQRQGEEWIKTEFPWMRAETILHAVSQVLYYAWHG